MRRTVAAEGCRPFRLPVVITRREAMPRRLRFCSRRCKAIDSMASSTTAAPPMFLPRLRAASWPSRVRSRMYSRSIPDNAASTVNTIPDGSCEPCRSPVRNSRPTSAALSCSASAANSRPRPSRLCSWTTKVTATPEARSSRTRATARSSSGGRVARVEIFSEKIRVTPASVRASSWVSRERRVLFAVIEETLLTLADDILICWSSAGAERIGHDDPTRHHHLCHGRSRQATQHRRSGRCAWQG